MTALMPHKQPALIAQYALANRDMLSLEKATSFLVARARASNPIGATELLKLCAFDRHGRGAFDERVKLAATTCQIYRELFPHDYANSQTPHFSSAREQEFYLLVETRLFPLGFDEYKDDPDFFLPYIPIKGNQQHDWVNGCCSFEDLQTVFKLALVLSGAKPDRWPSLGLKRKPAPPLAALGWTQFMYACVSDNSPLAYLPMVFQMIAYKTGNIWIDTPSFAGSFGDEWSLENMAKLIKETLQANKINRGVMELDAWLNADRNNLLRAVMIWNVAASIEAENDMVGVYVNE